MSSLKASAITPRIVSAFTRALSATGFSLALTTATLSTHAQAGCQYIIDNHWGNGFAAKIKITNDGTAAIDGWTVAWQYAGDNRMTSNYNAVFSGSNPYTASNLSWNKIIQPGQFIEFGVQGTKGNGAPEIPTVTGSACGTVATSSSSSVASSSRSSSSVATSSSKSSSSSSQPSSSSRASSSSAITAAWTLNATDSYLNFVTTKNTHNVEVHSFTGLSGDISSTGVATLTIDLNSVNTGVALRDQRMKDLLFETATYPTATLTLTVPATLISSLVIGQDQVTDISASLNLHGVSGAIATKVSVQKLSNSRILVQSLAPVSVKAGDYSLTNGVEALRLAVNIASISAAAPVDFSLVFDAR